MGGDVWRDIVGLAAGHLFYFLKDIVPIAYKLDILRTPAFVQRIASRISSSQTTNPRPAAGPAQPQRFFAGRGVRLGGN